MIKSTKLAFILTLLFLPAVSALAPSTSLAVQNQSHINVTYNGTPILFPDQKPLLKNNRTLVPIRPIAERLGFSVNWNSEKQTVFIVKGNQSVELVVNHPVAKRNNQAFRLEAPAQIMNGRTMVPVRFIAEALNYQVDWTKTDQTVKIADRIVFGQLEDIVVYKDEVQKQTNALQFVNYGKIVEEPALFQNVGNDIVLSRYMRKTYGNAIVVSDQEKANIHKQVREHLMGRYQNSEANLKQSMAAYGITEQDILEIIDREVWISNYVKSKITAAEMTAFYDRNPALFTTASVRHILVDTEAEANAVRQRLATGESFADLAHELSKDPGSKSNGGLYANADVNLWVKEFKEAALTQKIGQVGEPVKTQFGYHVIVVENRTVKPFDQVKESIFSRLYQHKLTELRAEVLQRMKKG